MNEYYMHFSNERFIVCSDLLIISVNKIIFNKSVVEGQLQNTGQGGIAPYKMISVPSHEFGNQPRQRRRLLGLLFVDFGLSPKLCLWDHFPVDRRSLHFIFSHQFVANLQVGGLILQQPRITLHTRHYSAFPVPKWCSSKLSTRPLGVGVMRPIGAQSWQVRTHFIFLINIMDFWLWECLWKDDNRPKTAARFLFFFPFSRQECPFA